MTKLANMKVVNHYIKQHEKDTSDKIYPNLMLVRSINNLIEDKNDKILDYACGYGANTLAIASHVNSITFADTSSFALQKTSNKFKKFLPQKNYKSILINPDQKTLPFEKEEFSLITCLSLLSLLSSPRVVRSLLKEFHKILKPNGKIFIDINGPESEFVKYSKSIGQNIYEYKGRELKEDPIRVYCPDTIEEFSKIVEEFFYIKSTGFTSHKLFKYLEHEFIIIGSKK